MSAPLLREKICGLFLGKYPLLRKSHSISKTALSTVRLDDTQRATYANKPQNVPKFPMGPQHKRDRRELYEFNSYSRKKRNFLHYEKVEEHRLSPLQSGSSPVEEETYMTAPRDYKYIMPEFLPSPDWQNRDRLREKLERMDMFRRRNIVTIPEFYVGTIMAITVSDPFAPDKLNRFLGICIDRGNHGLLSYCLLRNVVDGLGMEVKYLLYSPSIHKFEIIKLEKRLDDQLYYLRAAPPEYSTFPMDMDPVELPKESEVPVNTIQVPLNPPPWDRRHERKFYKGAIIPPISEKRKQTQFIEVKPWEPWDMMKSYRESINEDEEERIMAEVYKKEGTKKKPRSKFAKTTKSKSRS